MRKTGQTVLLKGNFIWFETASEESNFKRLKCCLKQNVLNLSRKVSLKFTKFLSRNLLYIHRYLKYVLLENKAFQLNIYVFEAT